MVKYPLLLVLLSAYASHTSVAGQPEGVCDKPRNAPQPFCDSSLPFDARVQNLIASLTLEEKIGALGHDFKGASQNVDLDAYNWWSEALHGVAISPAVHFRPPTEFSTVFPQIINLAASFNKELFFQVANATGNEARAFFNVGNAGLTFWSPNINIYRDPRWGRGHETPGEDPHLNSEYARQFIAGLQGNEHETGFLKVSACCKHFAAHSIETDRSSFNSIVTPQDMADTYLPAFRSCVQEAKVSCIMCAYNSINGIPACANKGFLTDVLRNQWTFDGYVVSDCSAVGNIMYYHNYTNTTSATCRAVLDAGMDVECERFLQTYVPTAVADGSVSVRMIETALSRAFKVMMRLGYFEKNETRPYKELTPAMVDNSPHRALALQAAKESIVLLKNAPNPNSRTGQPVLPLDPLAYHTNALTRASMALIGPHVDGTHVFLGNYNGIPSFIRSPLNGIRAYVPDVESERGCNVTSFNDSRLNEAEDLARAAEQVVLVVGINTDEVEHENQDRPNLTLPGLQNELIRRVLGVTRQPVIMFVVSGGALDLSEWQADPRVGAIIWAGYLGQSAGDAMAEVMFGAYNPSGRLTQTFYANDYVNAVEIQDMNMRPVSTNGAPGRTYRFYTGQPLYPFGYGLSYTSFEYTFVDTPEGDSNDRNDCTAQIGISVLNSGQRIGDHSVLWFLAPPGAGQGGRPIKALISFEKLTNLQPQETRQVVLCLDRNTFQLANEEGDFQVVTGEWKLTVGNLVKNILVL